MQENYKKIQSYFFVKKMICAKAMRILMRIRISSQGIDVFTTETQKIFLVFNYVYHL